VPRPGQAIMNCFFAFSSNSPGRGSLRDLDEMTVLRPPVASHSAAKDFVHIYRRSWATRGEPDD
jgi:hypothetical protein